MYLILGAGMLYAAISDIRTKKIPNALTFPLMLVGVLANTATGEGWQFALTGLGVAFALHYVLASLSLEGAGDAKLMMAVGAFLGWETMLEATVWRYVFLFPYGIIALTVMGRWANFIAASRWTLLKAQGVDAGERPEPTLLPFGPLLALSVPPAIQTDWLNFFL